jgi:hypothetical protein
MSFCNAETAAVFRDLLEEADDLEAFARDADDVYELADWIREDYQSFYGPNGNSLANSFSCIVMERINWREVAQALVCMLARRAERRSRDRW